MITVKLQGGLCNQLFQLATLEYVAKNTSRKFYINSFESPKTVHSNEQYYDTILKNWKQFYLNSTPTSVVQEYPFFREQNLISLVNNTSDNVMLDGYFQKYKYVDDIRNNFIDRLNFNTKIKDKYPDIANKTFIHVRGGDYVNHWFHDVKLIEYYKKCIELCSGDDFVIFTNDIEYAKSLFGDKYEIIEESEADTLYLMSLCKTCVCANSSFSWWGAYLNPNRKIFMPSKWFNDIRMDISGYYFPNVTIVNY